jgi:hypothetical protein
MARAGGGQRGGRASGPNADRRRDLQKEYGRAAAAVTEAVPGDLQKEYGRVAAVTEAAPGDP